MNVIYNLQESDRDSNKVEEKLIAEKKNKIDASEEVSEMPEDKPPYSWLYIIQEEK